MLNKRSIYILIPIVIVLSSCTRNSDKITSNNTVKEDTRTVLEKYLTDEEESPERLKELLDLGEDPNLVFYFENSSTTGDDVTALMIAITSGRYLDSDILLKYGADINKKAGVLEMTALNLFVPMDMIEEVEYLLGNGADPNIPVSDNGETEYSDGSDPLIQAILNNNFKMVKLLLNNNADPNTQLSDNGWTDRNSGATALFLATQLQNFDIVQLLLDKGAIPDKPRSDNGKTITSDGGQPLAVAITLENIEIINLLLEYGADPNGTNSENGLTKNSDATTVLMRAVIRDNLDIVKILVEAGANINKSRSSSEITTSSDGSFPLGLAAQSGKLDIVKYLVINGANIDQVRQDSTRVTSLMAASYYGYYDAVEYLLDKGANINLTSEKFGTALDNSIDGNQQEIVELLKQHGAVRAQTYTEKKNN